MGSPRANVRPDWAIIGWRDNDECWVLASTEIIQGELEAIPADDVAELPGRLFATRSTSYELHLGVRRFVLAHGPTYASALAAAMGTWNPDQPDTRTTAINATRQAIDWDATP